jgi:hypothetical protein
VIFIGGSLWVVVVARHPRFHVDDGRSQADSTPRIVMASAIRHVDSAAVRSSST